MCSSDLAVLSNVNVTTGTIGTLLNTNLIGTNSTITNILNTNVSSSSVNITGRAFSRQNANGFLANFTALPTTDGSETSLAFYNNTAGSSASVGQVWVVGQNAWGVSSGNFAIGTPSHGSILSMFTSGTSRFNNNLEIIRSGSVPSQIGRAHV